MANLTEKKGRVFGRISSFRTFTNGYPQLYETNSWKSINSSGDQLDFITDLFSALGSLDELQNAISRILLDKLDVIELNVKEALKASLKSNICCNINPSLWENPEIKFPVSEFDLLNMFQVNPESQAGRSLYFEGENGIKSKDMNVFLYHVITKSGTSGENWFQYKKDEYTKHLNEKSIGNFVFDENAIVDDLPQSNVVTLTFVKDSSNKYIYTKLNDWTSDYIDSVKFWDKETLIMQLLGKIFGGFGVGLSSEQIVLQQQIERILDNLSSCGGSGETDDSFFTFDNTSYSLMLEEAEIKKVNSYEYDKFSGTAVRITLEDITKAFNGLDQKESFEERKQLFDNAIDNIMESASAGNSDIKDSDKQQIKKNLLKNLLKELSLAFSMQLISPKIYLVILANMRMMGIKDDYDALTFIRKNLNLVNDIVGAIKDAILEELITDIKKMAFKLGENVLKELVQDNVLKFRKTLNTLVPRVNKIG